jgi:hypothetical protein
MLNPQFTPYVDRLFARLLVRYGDAWTRKWDGIPIEAVKADWLEQLEGIFARNPKAVAYALEHLPADFPPNSDQFLKLCLQKPAEHVALPAPVSKPDPAFASEVVKRIEAAKQADPEHGLSPGEICARRLERKLNEGGQKLTYPQRTQLEAIRNAATPAEFPTAGNTEQRKAEAAQKVAEYMQRAAHV